MTTNADTTDLGDLEPRVFNYTVGGAPYQLREATADTAAKYRNAAAKTAKMVDGKFSGVGNVGDLEPYLVSLCLFDSGGKAVPLDLIKTWPARVVKALYTKAKTASGLDEADDKTAGDAPGKGEPSATEPTSS